MSDIAFHTDDQRRVSVMGITRASVWVQLLVREVAGYKWVRPSIGVDLGRWRRPAVSHRWRYQGLVRTLEASAGPVHLHVDLLIGDAMLDAKAKAAEERAR